MLTAEELTGAGCLVGVTGGIEASRRCAEVAAGTARVCLEGVSGVSCSSEEAADAFRGGAACVLVDDSRRPDGGGLVCNWEDAVGLEVVRVAAVDGARAPGAFMTGPVVAEVSK